MHNTMQAIPWRFLFNNLLGFEAKCVSRAACVFCMSDGMSAFYRRKYPSARVETLQHPIALENIDAKTQATVVYKSEPYHLLFTGALNPSNFDAFENILKAFGGVERYELHVCSSMSKRQFDARFGDYTNLSFYGFVADEKMNALIAKAHVLILPHGLVGALPTVEYQTIFPTKVISYLGSGKPIFAHVPTDSTIDQYLRSHRVAVVENSPNKVDLLRSMDELLSSSNLRSELKASSAQALKYFNADVVVKRFKSLILS
jgi:hypothetical protein